MTDGPGKKPVTEHRTWLRALYMLLFILIYNLAEIIMLATAIFQWFSLLLTGKTNCQLLAFGRNLSIFIYQIWRYLTFDTEVLPFPFTPWPDARDTAKLPISPEQ